MKKKFLLIGLASIMLAFTGCGNGTTNETGNVAQQKDINPEELVKSAADKMASAKSYEALTAMNLQVASNGQQLNMDMNMDMDIINDPVTMKINNTTAMTMGEEKQNMDMEMYIEQADTGYVLYQNIDGAWYKSKIADEAGISEYVASPKDTLNDYIGLSDSVTLEGEETIDNVACYKLLMNIPMSKIGELMSDLGSVGENAEAMFGNLSAEQGDFGVDVFVSKEDETITKIGMDLSDILKVALKGQEGVEEKDLESIKFVMDMNFSNIDGVSEITIPEEAKAGTDLQ